LLFHHRIAIKLLTASCVLKRVDSLYELPEFDSIFRLSVILFMPVDYSLYSPLDFATSTLIIKVTSAKTKTSSGFVSSWVQHSSKLQEAKCDVDNFWGRRGNRV